MTDTPDAPDAAGAPVKPTLRPAPVTIDDFLRLDIRVGTIVAVDPFPQARQPAWRLEIDFGPAIGRRRSSARLTALYGREDLLDRQVAAVVNLPPRRIGPFDSEVLVLGFPDDGGRVVLISPERPVPDGGRL
ncbi:MAG: tRNA-binding protein, partial [Alphaproteobacteria bacterium]